MILKRANSTWSTMNSLWHRIRNAKPAETTKTVVDNTPSSNNNVVTPWTIAAPTGNKEPLKEFWIRTGLFRVSSQKLNLLGRQITRLPLPMAVLQMKFSPKKAAKEIHSLLLQAQARIVNLPKEDKETVCDPSKFVVQQAVVGKGPYLKRIDIKGRGRHGVIWRPHSFLRLQVTIPDAEAALRKRFKVHIKREDKPVMIRLNY